MTTPIILACLREELYRQFYAHRNKMGDPTSVRSPKEIFGSKGGEQVILHYISILNLDGSMDGLIF